MSQSYRVGWSSHELFRQQGGSQGRPDDSRVWRQLHQDQTWWCQGNHAAAPHVFHYQTTLFCLPWLLTTYCWSNYLDVSHILQHDKGPNDCVSVLWSTLYVKFDPKTPKVCFQFMVRELFITESLTPSPSLNPSKSLTNFLCNLTWHTGYPFLYFYIFVLLVHIRGSPTWCCFQNTTTVSDTQYTFH